MVTVQESDDQPEQYQQGRLTHDAVVRKGAQAKAEKYQGHHPGGSVRLAGRLSEDGYTCSQREQVEQQEAFRRDSEK